MGRGGSWGILSAEASPDTQSGPTPAFLALTAPLAPGQPLRPCALPGPAAAGEEGRRSRPSGAAGASSHRKSESGYYGTQAPEVVIRDWAPAARGTSGGAARSGGGGGCLINDLCGWRYFSNSRMLFQSAFPEHT